MDLPRTKEDRALMYCYKKLFAAAEPRADFESLVDNATINERGEKEIPFNDHVISQDKMDKIIKRTLRKFRIPKYKRKSFSAAVYLGCSPRFK